jgi:hypothetical protein
MPIVFSPRIPSGRARAHLLQLLDQCIFNDSKRVDCSPNDVCTEGAMKVPIPLFSDRSACANIINSGLFFDILWRLEGDVVVSEKAAASDAGELEKDTPDDESETAASDPFAESVEKTAAGTGGNDAEDLGVMLRALSILCNVALMGTTKQFC